MQIKCLKSTALSSVSVHPATVQDWDGCKIKRISTAIEQTDRSINTYHINTRITAADTHTYGCLLEVKTDNAHVKCRTFGLCEWEVVHEADKQVRRSVLLSGDVILSAPLIRGGR
jgi:hypothetical protein